MTRLYFSFAVLLFFGNLIPGVAHAQIDLLIKRVSPDSVAVVFEKNLVLHTDSIYAFMIRTNLDPAEKVYENLSGEPVEDGKILQAVFKQTEFNFQVYIPDTLSAESKPVVLREHVLQIKGTRLVVTLDGQPLNRFTPAPFSRSSLLAVELESERHKPGDLLIKDPVLFTWHADGEKNQSLPLADLKLQVEMGTLPGLPEPSDGSAFPLPVLILLPQVYSADQKPLLPENAQERLYTLILEN